MSDSIGEHETEPYDGCVRSQYNILEDSEEETSDIVTKTETTKNEKTEDPPKTTSNCCILI